MKRPVCSNCGRETYDKCDDCGAYVCDSHFAASIKGPEESCANDHLATCDPFRPPHPDDEPRGAGRDPYGRPDPSTHPECWTE